MFCRSKKLVRKSLEEYTESEKSGQITNMNKRWNYSKSGRGCYCFRGSFAYTEDDILVQRLHFFTVPPEMSVDALKAYFLTFGHVLNLQLGKDPKNKFEPCLSGDVLFANPKDAAKALKRRAPYVDGMEIALEPSYSWLQPDAYGPPGEDQQQVLGPISILTDDCWVNILQFLGLRDKVRFARSCQRFRAIYQMATAGQYKSVGEHFFQMTLWDIRDFYQMSGDQVQEVICTSDSSNKRYLDEMVELISVYCRNLISLTLEKEVVTKYTMLKMPTSIEILDFCRVVKDLPIICKHFCNLRELNVELTKVSGPAWSYIVKNNCCPSLEVLSLLLNQNGTSGVVAQLPKLKSLMIYYKNDQVGGYMIDQLVKYKAEQLERFEIYGFLSVSQLSQIAKLTGLRKLFLNSQFEMTGDVLKKFVSLKNLEEIVCLCLKVSSSEILDLFIGCPKLSRVSALFCPSPVFELVLKIVTQVRLEMDSKEIHRKLPIELVLNCRQTEVDEIILNNPEIVTEDIIKISATIGKSPSVCEHTSDEEYLAPE